MPFTSRIDTHSPVSLLRRTMPITPSEHLLRFHRQLLYMLSKTQCHLAASTVTEHASLNNTHLFWAAIDSYEMRREDTRWWGCDDIRDAPLGWRWWQIDSTIRQKYHYYFTLRLYIFCQYVPYLRAATIHFIFFSKQRHFICAAIDALYFLLSQNAYLFTCRYLLRHFTGFTYWRDDELRR
jgi:hypothetical protein